MSAKVLAAVFLLMFLSACSNEPIQESVCKGGTSNLLLRHGADLTAPIYIGASMAAFVKFLQSGMLTIQLSAQSYAMAFAICTGACLLAIASWIVFAIFGKPRVYCLESEVFVPPESWQMTHEELKIIMQAQGTFTDESTTFLSKTLERSATGQSTHWPPAAHPAKDGKSKIIADMTASREEAEAVIFPIVERVLAKTGIAPKDIDFLIVNCSLFSPTPSLCAMIAHKFKLRQDIRSYNLGGMGCSANVISVDLAKQLIQNQPGTRALVVSTEIITPNLYLGNEKSMLLQNSLFRCGGVALLLSSRRRDASSAKYELLYTGRVQISDDESYEAVFEKEDSEGNRAVALSKEIVNVAGRAMKANFTQLGKQILPFSEKAKVVCSRLATSGVSRARKLGLTKMSVPRSYVPDFTKAVDHFCIHAGGRAVIDGVQKSLGLADQYMEPSRKTLEDWGNTSSSSIWYEAEWVERFGNLQVGQRVLQISFGSGFKCNSAVWRALRVDIAKRGLPIKQCRLGKSNCSS